MNKHTGLEIAVVGMACRVPGANNIDEFWQLLRDGREGLLQASVEELREHGLPESRINDPSFVRRGGIIADSDKFDAEFFGMSPHEAQITDPQHRVFMELVWTALDDAGLGPHARGGSCGVFAGAGSNSYLLKYVLELARLGCVGDSEVVIANSSDYLASRIAYKLDLRGPAINIQSACSTSLVAIHYACQALNAGECSIAVAGGVRISQPQIAGYLHQPGGISSPDGHCRAFDVRAAGTVGGNGAGAVVLKRLEDALAAGDRIRGVILASAVNNDGANKVGYTAPSVSGQAQVIRDALATASINATSIGYVEAHGTGTPLGDPIEIAALRDAFGDAPPSSGRCAIGSVKSNIGHLDVAAGVVGLIKAVLILEYGEIPPSIHFTEPNPALELGVSRFRVQQRLDTWDGPVPRRAGVSSFGIGGTNAHVVLEQAPPWTATPQADSAHLLALSARTAPDLQRTATQLAEHLIEFPAMNLADVAHTTQVGRVEFPYRLAVACRTLDDAVARLTSIPVRQHARRKSDQKVALMLPGQGSEYTGMARRLYETSGLFHHHVDRCIAGFSSLLGGDFGDRVLGRQGRALDGSTAMAQAALFSIEYALGRSLLDRGVRPFALIGHSLGEITAACLAGVFDLGTAIRMVHARGIAMGLSKPGRMLAVAAGADTVTAWTMPDLCIAADNSPDQCIVAGSASAIDALCRELERRRTAFKLFPHHYAFHSPAMDQAAASLSEWLLGETLSIPAIPFISNVSGDWINAQQATSAAYWGSQLRSVVRFREGCRTLASSGVTLLVEAGPGDTLTRLVQQQTALPPEALLSCLPRKQAEDDSDIVFAEAVGGLWQRGIDIDWRADVPTGTRRIVSLPSYPFARTRYWAEVTRGPVAPRQLAATEASPATVDAKSTSPSLGPALYKRPGLAVDFSPPAGDAQIALAELFGGLLRIEGVGAHDSFFELGGDSLLGIRLVEQIRHRFDVAMPVGTLHDYPTVTALAEQLEQLVLQQIQSSAEG